MANASNELIFKLMIDGKEAIATLDTTQGEFVETGAAAELTADQIDKAFKVLKKSAGDTLKSWADFHNMADMKGSSERWNAYKREVVEASGVITQETTAAQRIIQNSYQSLIAESLKYNIVTDANVKKLTDFIKTQNLSANIIENTISVLQTEIKILDINSTAWKQKTAAATNLKAAYGQLITQHSGLDAAQKQVLPGMNSMNVAMGQLGYLIGDADMFMMNFRMGLMSIGNNIPMVVQYLQYAKQEASGLNMTLGQAFMKSITGAGGLLVGINLAVFAAQVFARVLSGTTEEVEKNTDAIKKNADALKEKSNIALNDIMFNLEKEVDLLKKKKAIEKEAFESREAMRERVMAARGEFYSPSTFTFSQQAELDKQSIALGQAQAQASILGKELSIQNRIKELTQERSSLTGREINYNERLLFLNEQIKKKQEELNEIQGKENKGDKDALNKRKQSASAKAKIQEDLFKDELLTAAKSELNGKDYVQLLEMKEDAENKYREHLKTFTDAKSQIKRDGFNFTRDVMEKNIELINKKIDEEEKLTEKEVEEGRKRASEKVKQREDDWKFEEEKKKWNTEATYKYESDPFEQRQKELDAEETLAIERAQLYGASEEQKTNIHNYYTKQREVIEQQSMFNTLNKTSQMLGQLAGLFGKHTAAYKLLATAQVWIETYKSVAALYAPPPVGVGPVLAPFMTAAVIGMGIAQTANIAKQDTTMKGYAHGGAIVGENGMEIIAPAEDYASGMAELVTRTAFEVRNYFNAGSGNDNSGLTNEVKMLREEIRDIASRPARAYLDNDEAIKIGQHYDYEQRTGR